MGNVCSTDTNNEQQQQQAAGAEGAAPTTATTSGAAAPVAADSSAAATASAPPSAQSAPLAADATAEPAPAPAPAATTTTTNAEMASTAPTTKAKIAIVYYSLYGHIATMAKAVAKGVEAAGAEVKVFQVAETLSQDILDKMHAPPKDASVQVLTDPTELEQFDGILFGTGTRFGMIPAQLKALFDATGGIWAKGGFVGKTGGIFFSTGTQGGGQETTALTFLTQLTHHGFIYIPIGYSDPSLFNMDEIHGGSPYGAGTFAGPTGARQPSALELGVAEHQGKYFANITGQLKRGRAA